MLRAVMRGGCGGRAQGHSGGLGGGMPAREVDPLKSCAHGLLGFNGAGSVVSVPGRGVMMSKLCDREKEGLQCNASCSLRRRLMISAACSFSTCLSSCRHRPDMTNVHEMYRALNM
jgi:hypothetical protein